MPAFGLETSSAALAGAEVAAARQLHSQFAAMKGELADAHEALRQAEQHRSSLVHDLQSAQQQVLVTACRVPMRLCDLQSTWRQAAAGLARILPTSCPLSRPKQAQQLSLQAAAPRADRPISAWHSEPAQAGVSSGAGQPSDWASQYEQAALALSDSLTRSTAAARSRSGMPPRSQCAAALPRHHSRRPRDRRHQPRRRPLPLYRRVPPSRLRRRHRAAAAPAATAGSV